MTPTLNQADLKLLKSVFATKQDLAHMEKRMDAKYATKSDLATIVLDLKKYIEAEVDKIYQFLHHYFQDIKLEEKPVDHEERLTKLETQYV